MMRSICLVLAVLLAGSQQIQAAATAEYAGEHYNVTAYTAGAWNYDYSHTLEGGVCKSGSTTIICTTTNKCGPACWSLAGASNSCAGSKQTPINLVAANIDQTLSPPEFIVTDGGCDKWVQFGDDHAFEVSFADKACTNLKLKYGGTTYTFLQFHFHAPAEHAVAGGLGAAELHMVHKSADGKLLVLGVIMAANGIPAGGGNQFLKKFWDVAYDGFEEVQKPSTAPCYTTFSQTAATSTTVGSTTTLTFNGALTTATTPSVGDTLVDKTGSSCFPTGTTVSSTSLTSSPYTLTMSAAATSACTVKTFGYVSATNPPFISKSCNPAYFNAVKENQVKTATGSDLVAGQCKYALEYEAEGQTAINPYVEFLPRDKTFYTYSGSLTTYPCTEGVTWIVFEEPMLVGKDDVARIMAASACGTKTITKFQTVKSQSIAYADNRPLQPLGSRTLSKYVPSAPTVAPTMSPESPVSIAAIVVGSVGLVSAAGALGYLLAQRNAKLQSARVSVVLPNLLPINEAAAISTDTQTA